MKKKLIILLAVLTLITAFSSCKKEKTIEEQVVGTWKVTEFETPTIPRTSTSAYDPNLNMVLTLKKDKTAISILGTDEQICDWEFIEPDIIKVTRSNGMIAVGTFRYENGELLLESQNITMFLIRQ